MIGLLKDAFVQLPIRLKENLKIVSGNHYNKSFGGSEQTSALLSFADVSNRSQISSVRHVI